MTSQKRLQGRPTKSRPWGSRSTMKEWRRLFTSFASFECRNTFFLATSTSIRNAYERGRQIRWCFREGAAPVGLNCRIPCHWFAFHWIRIVYIDSFLQERRYLQTIVAGYSAVTPNNIYGNYEKACEISYYNKLSTWLSVVLVLERWNHGLDSDWEDQVGYNTTQSNGM